VTDAAKQGKLLKNVVDLSEKVVSENVKEVQTSPESNSLVRAFQISKVLGWGVLDFTNQKWVMIRSTASTDVRNLLQNRIYPFMDQISTPAISLISWPFMQVSRLVRGTSVPTPSEVNVEVEINNTNRALGEDNMMKSNEELKSHDESNIPPNEKNDLNFIEDVLSTSNV